MKSGSSFEPSTLVEVLRCPAPYVPVSLYYLTGGAFTLLAVVAVLALLLGVTLGDPPYIWTAVVALGFTVICWLSALYLLYRGGRLLHQGTAMSSSSGQS